MQNSQANTKKIFTKFFWRAGKVTSKLWGRPTSSQRHVTFGGEALRSSLHDHGKDNQIGDVGAKALGAALTCVEHVAVLDLSINQLTAEGAKAIPAGTNHRELQKGSAEGGFPDLFRFVLTLQSLLFSISFLFFVFRFSLLFLAFFLPFPRMLGVPRREKPLLFWGKTLAFSKKARVGGSGLF